jgi:hypothetical protein
MDDRFRLFDWLGIAGFVLFVGDIAVGVVGSCFSPTLLRLVPPLAIAAAGRLRDEAHEQPRRPRRQSRRARPVEPRRPSQRNELLSPSDSQGRCGRERRRGHTPPWNFMSWVDVDLGNGVCRRPVV